MHSCLARRRLAAAVPQRQSDGLHEQSSSLWHTDVTRSSQALTRCSECCNITTVTFSYHSTISQYNAWFRFVWCWPGLHDINSLQVSLWPLVHFISFLIIYFSTDLLPCTPERKFTCTDRQVIISRICILYLQINVFLFYSCLAHTQHCPVMDFQFVHSYVRNNLLYCVFCMDW